MRFFNMMTKFPMRQIHGTPYSGSEAIEIVKKNIAQKKFSDALILVNKIELEHPEYFKAISVFRGKAAFGLAKEMNLISDKGEAEEIRPNLALK